MRYFKTSNASRPYTAGGFAFNFEPVENIGGSWLGVLAVADEAAANSLVAAKIPQVTEITPEEYDGLKKKPSPQNSSFRELLPHPSSPQRPAATPAPVASTSSSSPSTPLQTKAIDVPDDLKLETGDKRPRRK